MVYIIAGVWLVVFIVLVVAFRLYPRPVEPDYKAIARDTLSNELPEFKANHLILKAGQGDDGASQIHGFAIDNDAEQFCLIEGGLPECFTFKQAIECQLLIGGDQKESVSRLLKFTGTELGNTIFEAYQRFGEPKPEPKTFLGFEIKEPGKWWFWSKADEPEAPEDKSINLRLIVDDAKPFRTYAFLENEEPDDEEYFLAKKQADSWFALFKKVLAKADEKVEDPDVAKLCIADELVKLLELRESGVLSEEEFIRVKTRLVEA